MTLSERIRLVFRQSAPPAAPPVDTPPVNPLPKLTTLPHSLATSDPQPHHIAVLPAVPPYWLTDPDTLRDEGVLFGLSDAQPDEKVAEITAYFRHQTVPVNQQKEQSEATLTETNRQLKERETQTSELQARIDQLTNQRPATDNVLRNLVSLAVSVVMCVGAFHLVDETLRPAFSNRWIAIGVFLAGMFNLSGRTSFFYEEGIRLTGRRIVEEIGLPLAAALFVLIHALQRQPLGQAIALFVFVLFLFLLAGKLLLSVLTQLRSDLVAIGMDRQRKVDREQALPGWESQLVQLKRELEALRAQQVLQASASGQQEAALSGLNAQRDQLVNLFLSEFELARSLRYRLSEQQRQAILHG